jgi:hypothetical protein
LVVAMQQADVFVALSALSAYACNNFVSDLLPVEDGIKATAENSMAPKSHIMAVSATKLPEEMAMLANREDRSINRRSMEGSRTSSEGREAILGGGGAILEARGAKISRKCCKSACRQ